MINRLKMIVDKLNKEVVSDREYYSTKNREKNLTRLALNMLEFMENNGYFDEEKDELIDVLYDVNEAIVGCLDTLIEDLQIEDEEINTVVNIFAEVFAENEEAFSLIEELDSRLETPNFYYTREEIDFDELKENILAEIKDMDFAKIFAETQEEVKREILNNKKTFADIKIKMDDFGIYRF